MLHHLPPERPTRRRATRPCPVSAALLVLASLLASCAAPGPKSSSSSPLPGLGPIPSAAAPVMDTVKVLDLRGTATARDGARQTALKSGSNIGENWPVQVGSKSTLRLGLGKRAVFEFGPNSRFVVHQLPRDGSGEARATWLRLEQGYLRVAASDDRVDAPIEVSFSRWAARLEPGESFFEARNDGAAACAANGRLHLSGVPEWTPQDLDQSCATLQPLRAPVSVALSEAEWSALRTRRRLQPVLARAADLETSRAVARMKRERSDPGLSSGSTSAAPLMQTIAYMPPAPGVEPVSMPAYATPPPAPAVTIFTNRPEQAFESRTDAPAVAKTETLSTIRVPAEAVQREDAGLNPGVAMDAEADAPVVDNQTAVDEPLAKVSASALASSPDRADGQFTVPASTAPASIQGPSSLATATSDPAGASLKWNRELSAEAIPSTAPAPRAGNLDVAVYSTDNGMPPSEVPMPESATIAPPPPAAENLPAEWIINVASYPSVEAAQQYAQQLEAQNYAASVRQETVRGRASYRVVIEGLPTESAAQDAAKELSSRYGLQSAWVLRKH